MHQKGKPIEKHYGVQKYVIIISSNDLHIFQTLKNREIDSIWKNLVLKKYALIACVNYKNALKKMYADQKHCVSSFE